ncbi:hypothetical protein I3843_13G038500 [Carya illinoinensis]|nr:hypothetical protein I3843_13G038500 [Carya illinoinensis]
MSQLRDPAIKLFGRNIPVTDSRVPSVSEKVSDLERQTASIPTVMYGCEEATITEVDDPFMESSCEQDNPSELDTQRETDNQNPTQENEAKVERNSEQEKIGKGGAGGQAKALKKSNKVLPCPRCNSSETKFCYFNNYNVNQPRYFCKNCQRYWTAGGTIRNVPVGAGRRKNKHSSSPHQQVVEPSNVLPVTRTDSLSSVSNQHPSCAGLEFNKDAPLCESMTNVLNLKDQKKNAGIGPSASEDSSDEPLPSGSSLAAAAPQGCEFPEKELMQVGLPGHCNSFIPTHGLQCYPISQSAYHWNPGWNATVFGSSGSISNPGHMGSPPMVPVPGFCAPTFSFLPAPYWGCMQSWDASLVGSTGSPSASSSTSNGSCSGNSSPTLGKHSRDANPQSEETKERSLWVPKTLRIDDPEEAAKSSIWSTLGIKPEKDKPSIRDSIFKASKLKSDTSSRTSDADHILKANPAAFSRCQSFQEST